MDTRKSVVYSRNVSLHGTCGADVYCDFHLTRRADRWDHSVALFNVHPHGGSKISCAGFINTQECRMAYEWLCKKYTLVYQSEVRRNANSGHPFFFCVFDRKKAK